MQNAAGNTEFKARQWGLAAPACPDMLLLTILAPCLRASDLPTVFSGAWPHAKIVTTLLCWFLPESVLCAAYREALLFWTYVFNKYRQVNTLIRHSPFL